jgi:molecular chaperone HscB
MQNHFARFGLPLRYLVDLAALERAYTQLSFELHPDFLATAPAEERQRAQQAAAELNEGYTTLRNEPERAAYLLALLVAQARDAGRLPVGHKLDSEALPEGFLQEMFLLQEEVDDAAGNDAAGAALREQVAARHRDTLAARAALFERAAASLAAATQAAADLQAIQSNLNQEKYLLRLLERLAPRSAA